MTTQSENTQLLSTLRSRLLVLHKALLDMEKLAHEQLHGRVDPAELLRLALSDERFAWLRVISSLIVLIDEFLDAKDSVEDTAEQTVIRQAEKLLTPSEINEDFGLRYQTALQRDPSVVIAHQEVRAVLLALRK